jgi:hypothetical protein
MRLRLPGLCSGRQHNAWQTSAGDRAETATTATMSAVRAADNNCPLMADI